MGRITGLSNVFQKSFQLVSPATIYGVTTTLKETLGNRITFNNCLLWRHFLRGNKVVI